VHESPAAKAGVERHDIVLAIGGTSVGSREDLLNLLRERKPGDRVELEVRRGKETRKLSVTLGAFKPEEPPSEKPPAPKAPKKPGAGFLGVRCGPVPELLAGHLDLEAGADIILSVDGAEVRDGKLVELLKGKLAGDKVKLETIHKGKPGSHEVTLGSRPAEFLELGPDLRWELPGDGAFDSDDPAPRGSLFRLPRFRGRLHYRDADGNEEVIEIPHWEENLEKLGEKFQVEIEKQLKSLPKHLKEELSQLEDRLAELSRKFQIEDGELDDSDAPAPGQTYSRQVSVSRISEDGYDITVRNDNGRVTVTVEKDGKRIADELAEKDLGTLPEDVRARVRRAREALPGLDLKGPPGLRLEKPEPKAKKIDAKETKPLRI
jgi:hypothetical protein